MPALYKGMCSRNRKRAGRVLRRKNQGEGLHSMLRKTFQTRQGKGGDLEEVAERSRQRFFPDRREQ